MHGLQNKISVNSTQPNFSRLSKDVGIFNLEKEGFAPIFSPCKHDVCLSHHSAHLHLHRNGVTTEENLTHVRTHAHTHTHTYASIITNRHSPAPSFMAVSISRAVASPSKKGQNRKRQEKNQTYKHAVRILLS